MDLGTFAPQELLKILATLLHEIATANDEFQRMAAKTIRQETGEALVAVTAWSSTPAESSDNMDASAMRKL